MSLTTPLSRARGTGSARHGVSHWWLERLLAIGLIPLVLWFCFSVASLVGADHAAVTEWIASPFNTMMLILLIYAGYRHGQMGLQLVIQDYVQLKWLQMILVIGLQFFMAGLGVATVVAVLKVSFGG